MPFKCLSGVRKTSSHTKIAYLKVIFAQHNLLSRPGNVIFPIPGRGGFKCPRQIRLIAVVSVMKMVLCGLQYLPNFYLGIFQRIFFFVNIFLSTYDVIALTHPQEKNLFYSLLFIYKSDRYENFHDCSDDEVLQISHFTFSIMAEFLMTSPFLEFFKK